MFKRFVVVVAFTLLFTSNLIAQSAESATSVTRALTVGAEVSTFNPDWGCNNSSVFTCWDGHLLGITAVANAGHVVWRIGVEGEGRWLHWEGPLGGLMESNYLAGPRYPLYRTRRFGMYVKTLFGMSRITRPYGLGEGSYFTVAPGGTVEYGLTRKVLVRADYEYQIWPTFQGLPGEPTNGLSPNGFSFGFGYRL